MSDLSQQQDGATIIADNTDISLNRNASCTGQEIISAPAAPNNCTLSKIRMEKVLAVRQQLAEGTYDIDGRLDIALDRLLEDLTG